MRVISGQLGGRVFNTPDSKRVHPMSEKVRGAIFSALGDIAGLEVLDIYSGSGALAIEAISRGVAGATAVEADSRAAKIIAANSKLLAISDKLSLSNARVEAWLKFNTKQYDLIIADPPYDNIPNIVVLNSIAELLSPACLLVLSWPGKLELPEIKHLELIKHKSFNDAQVGYYRRGPS